MNNKRLTLLVIMIFSLSYTACTQSEVVVDKVIAKINEQIGKYEVQLKSAEKMLIKLKKAQRKAKINSKMSAKNGDGYKSAVDQADSSVKELQSQFDKIEAILSKGSPYKTSKGKTLTKAKLNGLKIKVKTKLSVAAAKLRASQKALQVSVKSKEGNSAISDQLSLKIAQLEGKVEILKNNIDLLNDMEEQRKLKSDYDSELAKGLLKEMDKTIGELDSIIEVDLEEVYETSSTDINGVNNGLSNDDVNLIDEL